MLTLLFVLLAGFVAGAGAPIGVADHVLIEKSARKLTLLRDGAVLATYRVALGFTPKGDKTRQGDGRTPEGIYKIDWRNVQSRFHRSLHISYPNAADRAEAASAGVDPGGDIFIHGGGSAFDWTLGCIAVTNDEIEEIWRVVPDGTPVEITP